VLVHDHDPHRHVAAQCRCATVLRQHPQLHLAHLLVVEGAQRVQRARLRLHRHVRRQRRATHPPLAQTVPHARVLTPVRVPRPHRQHQRARRVVLGQPGAVARLAEHRRVVVHVQHPQAQHRAAPQRRRPAVGRPHRHVVLRHLLPVQ
ncbi:hypothetical protein N307_15515, partial [Dryobates pubescens]